MHCLQRNSLARLSLLPFLTHSLYIYLLVSELSLPAETIVSTQPTVPSLNLEESAKDATVTLESKKSFGKKIAGSFKVRRWRDLPPFASFNPSVNVILLLSRTAENYEHPSHCLHRKHRRAQQGAHFSVFHFTLLFQLFSIHPFSTLLTSSFL